MIKILANDGIHPDGQMLLEEAGYQVDTTHIPQEQLLKVLPNYDAVIVRSATKIRKDLIAACPRLKVIARGGVGMDNIDVDFAKTQGKQVINTPNASSQAVAELVIGQIFTLARGLHFANRQMPEEGATEFKKLKELYSEGLQVKGKTLGIIGFGRIGLELAKMALGLGMRVIAHDLNEQKTKIAMSLHDVPQLSFQLDFKTTSFEKVLAQSDFLSLHVPFVGLKPILGAAEFNKMKRGSFIINTSRGGTVDELELINALNSGQIAGAALDVFDNEPKPKTEILQHPRISLTPHIGASTLEAQRYIGLELADALIAIFDTN